MSVLLTLTVCLFHPNPIFFRDSLGPGLVQKPMNPTMPVVTGVRSLCGYIEALTEFGGSHPLLERILFPLVPLRAQKTIGLVGGSPDYIVAPNFEVPEVPVRTYQYSADGRLYAYALASGVRIFQAEGAQLLQELPIPNIVDIKFSPRGTYLSTWERPVKLEDGEQHKNLRVFSSSTGEELISFTQKSQEAWDLQYTISESHAIRLVGAEVQVFRPAEWAKGVVDKLKVENATSVSLSPGLNPSIAVFVAEKKGQPASIKIYGLLSLNSPPTCQKTFFKAQRSTIKWNDLGTQVLLLTQTDVDNSNKSYYGETGGLYLLSAAGNFDCKVTLDKDGPIHDFAWSPTSKEFGVVYGFVPAKTMIFDQRVRTIHDFGSAPTNFISFNPQGRLVMIAGFVWAKYAPLMGQTPPTVTGLPMVVSSWLQRFRPDCESTTVSKYTTAVGLSCMSSLSTNYTRPRGDRLQSIKSRHLDLPCRLLHLPTRVFLANAAVAKPTPTRPAGAYRPPGARGLATPAIFKREDEGGVPHVMGTHSGSATPPRYNRSPVPGSAPQANGGGPPYSNGGERRRHVPGAPGSAPHSPSPGPDGEKKNRRKKGKKDGEDGSGEGYVNGNGNTRPRRKDRERNGGGEEPRSGRPSIEVTPAGEGGKPNGSRSNSNGNVKGSLYIPPPDLADGGELSPSVATPGADGALDPIAKKVRNLNKKLKAIDELKEKAKRGERLEATQLKKMEGEAEIRKELAGLGA
ncbi:Eukaryotic translation initiation factor 2A [Mycena indigotica]|uniref:Eukaryotic translation initiation factor 2A n=1 Tax=Mycena indigotica TaxID=2126181 RepID=A0A8H6TCL3_9AGAR|nr:Eukaryotic translation initiation factor 2A [Mycena indigotica]KAF7315000.1 Eukaryotic translation initiation factor 2A [Mycena indigotica]